LEGDDGIACTRGFGVAMPARSCCWWVS